MDEIVHPFKWMIFSWLWKLHDKIANVFRKYSVVIRTLSLTVKMDHLSCRILAHITSHFYNHCCKSWSAQAWKLLGNVHMPKPASVQACIHLQCTSSGQTVAPVYKECPSLYMLCTSWALAWAHVYISKQFPSLGTPTSTAVIWLQLLCTQSSNNL